MIPKRPHPVCSTPAANRSGTPWCITPTRDTTATRSKRTMARTAKGTAKDPNHPLLHKRNTFCLKVQETSHHSTASAHANHAQLPGKSKKANDEHDLLETERVARCHTHITTQRHPSPRHAIAMGGTTTGRIINSKAAKATERRAGIEKKRRGDNRRDGGKRTRSAHSQDR